METAFKSQLRSKSTRREQEGYISQRDAIYKGKSPIRFEINLAPPKEIPCIKKSEASDQLVVDEKKGKFVPDNIQGINQKCKCIDQKGAVPPNFDSIEVSLRNGKPFTGDNKNPPIDKIGGKENHIVNWALELTDSNTEDTTSRVVCTHTEGIKKPVGFSRKNPMLLRKQQRQGCNPKDYVSHKTVEEKISANNALEVMCSKCNKMISVEDIEIHSKKCYYDPKQEDAEGNIEEKLPPIYKLNCLLNKLRKCIEKSKSLQTILPLETRNEICDICQLAENVVDANEKGICTMREMIVRLTRMQKSIQSISNPTAFLYLERIVFTLKLKNAEFGKTYTYIHGMDNSNSKRQTLRSNYSNEKDLSGFISQANRDIESIAEETPSVPNRDLSACNRSQNTSILSLGVLSSINSDQSNKMALKRIFFNLCAEIAKEMKKSNPSFQDLDKEKLFAFVRNNSIQPAKWKKIVLGMFCKQNPEFLNGKPTHRSKMGSADATSRKPPMSSRVDVPTSRK